MKRRVISPSLLNPDWNLSKFVFNPAFNLGMDEFLPSNCDPVEPARPNRLKLETDPVEPARPNRLKSETDPVEPARPNRLKLETDPVEPARPNRLKLETDPVEPARPNRLKLETDPVEPARPKRLKLSISRHQGQGFYSPTDYIQHQANLSAVSPRPRILFTNLLMLLTNLLMRIVLLNLFLLQSGREKAAKGVIPVNTEASTQWADQHSMPGQSIALF